MSAWTPRANDRRTLRHRIDAIEQRLQARRQAATRQACALDDALRVAATAPLTLLLAASAGFLAERRISRAARRARPAADSPAARPSRLRDAARALQRQALSLLGSVRPYLVVRPASPPATADTAPDAATPTPRAGQRLVLAMAGLALLGLGAWLASGIATSSVDAWVHVLPPFALLLAVVIWAGGGTRRS